MTEKTLIEKWKKKRFKPKGGIDGTYRRVFSNRSIKMVESDLRKAIDSEIVKHHNCRDGCEICIGNARLEILRQKIFGSEKVDSK